MKYLNFLLLMETQFLFAFQLKKWGTIVNYLLNLCHFEHSYIFTKNIFECC